MSTLFLERGGTKTVPQRSSKSRASLRGSNCRRNFFETGRLSRDRCATYDAYGQIYRQSYHGNIQRTENSSVKQRSCEAGVCSVRDHRHGETGADVTLHRVQILSADIFDSSLRGKFGGLVWISRTVGKTLRERQ